VPADLEARGAGELAEDQAGPVVEGLEGLRVELVQAALLAPGLGVAAIDWSATGGSLTKHSVQPAA
jgi:hypothetical protein